jgi:hypothetical protein
MVVPAFFVDSQNLRYIEQALGTAFKWARCHNLWNNIVSSQ